MTPFRVVIVVVFLFLMGVQRHMAPFLVVIVVVFSFMKYECNAI
jgi:hypothetical protein